MFSIIEFVKETKKTDLEVRLVIRVQEVSWTHFNYFHFFSILRVINIFCSNAANFQVSSSQLCPRIGTRIFCPNPNGRPLCTVGLWPERRLAGAPFLPTRLAVALTTLLPCFGQPAGCRSELSPSCKPWTNASLADLMLPTGTWQVATSISSIRAGGSAGG